MDYLSEIMFFVKDALFSAVSVEVVKECWRVMAFATAVTLLLMGAKAAYQKALFGRYVFDDYRLTRRRRDEDSRRERFLRRLYLRLKRVYGYGTRIIVDPVVPVEYGFGFDPEMLVITGNRVIPIITVGALEEFKKLKITVFGNHKKWLCQESGSSKRMFEIISPVVDARNVVYKLRDYLNDRTGEMDILSQRLTPFLDRPIIVAPDWIKLRTKENAPDDVKVCEIRKLSRVAGRSHNGPLESAVASMAFDAFFELYEA